MEKYKYSVKERPRVTSCEDAIGIDVYDKCRRLQIEVERVKELIALRMVRTKQLEAAATAAREYLGSKLQEINDPDQNRIFVCKGIEHVLDTIDKQLAEHKETIVKILK